MFTEAVHSACTDIIPVPSPTKAITGWSGNATYYSFGDTCSVASCPAGTKIDSHSELDLVVTREFSESLDAYLTIMNVTDEEDIVARAPKNGARAQMPRAALVGLRWKF